MRQDPPRLLVPVARELGQRHGVVRLAARLLGRVVDQHRVGLVPRPAVQGPAIGGDGVHALE